MKVTIEGTTEEMLEVAELIAYGRAYRGSIRGPKDRDTATDGGRVYAEPVRPGDDVPNRDREEGVQ